MGKETWLFSQKYACPEHNISIEELTPRMFSFNNSMGFAKIVQGWAFFQKVDPDLIVPNVDLSIAQEQSKPLVGTVWMIIHRHDVLSGGCRERVISLDTPVKDLPDHAMKSFLYGTTKELFLHRIQENGKSTGYRAAFEGVIPNLERRAREGSEWAKAEISAYMSAVPCPVCHGKRLKKEVLGVTVGGLNIMELTDLSITESLQFFETLSLTEQEQKIAMQILKEIKERLGFLKMSGWNT